MASIGYDYLRSTLNLPLAPLKRSAEVSAVTRVEREEHRIRVPRAVAPSSDRPIEHVLFALKHEGVNLQVLAEALPRIHSGDLVSALHASPTGQYIRSACYLWELFTGERLQGIPAIGGPTHPLFDPDLYFTGPATRDARWRIAFNGLGTPRYCATIDRTPDLVEYQRRDILGRTAEFAEQLQRDLLDRAIEWAYLSETQHSYAIEREEAPESKTRKFIAMLHAAHDGRKIDEPYLVELQNAAISNIYDKAASFRGEQNYMANGPSGALSVTYVPPPPDLAHELMEELMQFVNTSATRIDPILVASTVSFGFVFVHPFMDGNGRLSRFLFHKALCMSGALKDGLLLPVSVAMKRHQNDYLAALQSVSKPLRSLWHVHRADETGFDAVFHGSPAAYRYWDATACARFGYRMAEVAFDHELRKEAEYLVRFDNIRKTVDETYDIRASTLALLIGGGIRDGGRISKNLRNKFAIQVPTKVIDHIESIIKSELNGTSPQDAAGQTDLSEPHMG